jgi:3',5'-cyclic AMP phosphodiesterase CpdA
MKIAHVTDIHWMVPPDPMQIWYSKRALGTVNLYLRGRRHHFHEQVQEALVAYVVHMSPDLVLVTGDLTAQAIPDEFEKARKALDPILSRIPTFVIPGNHDTYTPGAFKTKRIRRWFGPWMGLERHPPVGRLDLGDVTVLGLDPNRAWFDASGLLPQDQLDRLGEVLADPTLAGRFLILAIHYPLLTAKGRLYDDFGHGLRNAKDLVAVLAAAPRRPDLIVHGHKHHGYHGFLELPDGARIEIHNPGSGGYAYNLDAKRAAACNEYVIEGGRVVRMERHLFDGRHFAIEAGGAYATGF